MATITATTELVRAIERVLHQAGTRITTGVIVDRAAERLTPGVPPVRRREDNPDALIYDTATKELSYTTGQARRSGGENHPHFRRWIVRDYNGGYWVNLEVPELDLMFMHFHSVKVCRPKSGDGNRSKGSRRPPEAAARQFVAQLIGAQLAKCDGWGADERRPTHLEVDHIIPWLENGPAELGNLQALCSACHLQEGTRSQTELWEWMIDHEGMWDEEAARFAHYAAINLRPRRDIGEGPIHPRPHTGVFPCGVRVRINRRF